MIIPVYQGEIAHPSIRGRVTALQQFMLGIGAFIAGESSSKQTQRLDILTYDSKGGCLMAHFTCLGLGSGEFPLGSRSFQLSF